MARLVWGITGRKPAQAPDLAAPLNHIVNLYQTGGGAWAEPGYREFLERCLACLNRERPPRTTLALAMAELAATAFLEWSGTEATAEVLARRLAGATPPLRAAAGRVVGRLGDPRPGAGVIHFSPGPGAGTDSVSLPDLSWCEVPGGPFLVKGGWPAARPNAAASRFFGRRNRSISPTSRWSG